MAEFLLFYVPGIIYLLVQSRAKASALRAPLERLGCRWGPAHAYLWALMLLVPLILISWLAANLVPADLLQRPGIVVPKLTSAAVIIGVLYRAVGEEFFFRGLLGGVLMRRLGVTWGNITQAILFLLPHLPLLLIDAQLWPLLPVQFITGWALGWLRWRSDSFAPGAALHSVVNVAAAYLAYS